MHDDIAAGHAPATTRQQAADELPGRHVAAIALGASLGDRAATIREAVTRIGRLGRVGAISALKETPAWPDPSAPPYLNGALLLRTALTPEALMRELLGIERALGRERSSPNAPRTIDLDLLLYDGLARNAPGLTVPHPRMHRRAFVLAPLAQIAPDMVHPVLGASIADPLADLGEGRPG